LSAADEQIAVSVGGETGDASGFLIIEVCTPVCAEAGNSGESVVIDTDDVTDITLTLVVTCVTGGTVDVTASQNGSSETTTVECVVDGSVLGGFFQVVATATPNLLPCEGGVAEIVANAYDTNGNPYPDPYFHFSTTRGLIEQTSDNTADLTLGPNQTSATVTVSIADPGENEVETAEVFVSLDCNGFASLVITANPNVIECGGTSVLTATARDANGHVVPGVGFHWATSTGLLVVQPNHAGNEAGIAHLTLQPGMPDSTVVVSVGTNTGTVEGTITVQQFCPGVVVGQNASAASGVVTLNRSNDNLVCGETVFIGIKVRDQKGQVPPDGTPVNLVATSGLLERADLTEQPGATALVTVTLNGAANVTYTAPGASGEVRITAAAGDSFGYTTLKVNCGGATGTGGIIPPNTGRITPPNTGDAGLK
jgi:hypothetical protein